MATATTLDNRVPLTCEDTVGPYYPVQFLDGETMDLTQIHPGLSIKARGVPIVLLGRVLDLNGKLATGVLLEFWQADANGRMRGPHNASDPQVDPAFRGFARCRVDGTFSLKTIMPGAVEPEVPGEEKRAPFITLTIFSDGISRVVTQVFFEGSPENDADPVLMSVPDLLRERLVARRVDCGHDAVPAYEIDIIMAGDGETPFFDDEFLTEG